MQTEQYGNGYNSDDESNKSMKIPFLSFKRWLNHRGMAVMHEDAAALVC